MNKNLKLKFNFDNCYDEIIEEEGTYLFEEIKDLGIGEVNFEKAIDNQRDGKAIGDILWNTLNIAIITIAEIKPLITILENYLNKNERYSVKIKLGEKELELKGVSKEERKKLIDKFLDEVNTELNTGESENE